MHQACALPLPKACVFISVLQTKSPQILGALSGTDPINLVKGCLTQASSSIILLIFKGSLKFLHNLQHFKVYQDFYHKFKNL